MNAISDTELTQFQRFIYDAAGISLSTAKKALISGRLGKRLAHCGVDSFGAYMALLRSGQHPQEVQTAVDLLTTNETYFFREIKHFEFLRQWVLRRGPCTQPLRVWSAASSSGEEAYSIAMVLADLLPSAPWEVVGTDISTRMLQHARRALYPLERARHVPQDYLHRFCRKGQQEYSGMLLVDRRLRERVHFVHANLNAPLPELGVFDIIFLRNVMIYFDLPTKQQVVARVLQRLAPQGYFLVGHSESLNDVSAEVVQQAPATYRRAGAP